MKLEHEFTVEVPLEQAWNALSGADAVAACLPHAQLRSVDGLQTGRIELDADHGVWGEGRIITIDRDDDEHVATVAMQGRQVGGPGVGSVTLRSALTQADAAATRVSLSAEVSTSGHDPGNGFEAAATQLLQEVARGLAQRARELPAPAERVARQAAGESASAVSAPPPAPASRKRLPAAVALGLGAAGAVIAAAAVRRRRGAR
jgi:carbon monoxide dehydrogenase subunit G